LPEEWWLNIQFFRFGRKRFAQRDEPGGVLRFCGGLIYYMQNPPVAYPPNMVDATPPK
jgi:hypothetical protein